jgi:hypothetical protein
MSQSRKQARNHKSKYHLPNESIGIEAVSFLKKFSLCPAYALKSNRSKQAFRLVAQRRTCSLKKTDARISKVRAKPSKSQQKAFESPHPTTAKAKLLTDKVLCSPIKIH